ncbi:HAMP domain-containing protein [Loktanella sp. TSTF-M6]|uniref:histidine kinase n=1 Tax=Loktanella gaetbuli TaxID=2881335 RepID=A0ABS8BSB2_9RHOB|nr:ATP-binding protein [Loktanella gaetbuli]MCB5198406.1 HAMP domain-containing protein [Loktanella gaetbuli]
MRNLSVRFRLSVAILTLCAVTLVISGISLLMLRNAENWLETIHRDTLAEVSQALDISRNAADLATAAPFLLTVQMPFQRTADAQAILSTIDRLEALSSDTTDLALPLARMRVAIGRLLGLTEPQNALRADIAQVDIRLTQLQGRFTRQANAPDLAPVERLEWAALGQLTGTAREVARSQNIIEVGEFSRRYRQNRADIPRGAIVARGLAEVDAALNSPSGDLFQLQYGYLTAGLDAENALFRIRELSDTVNAYAAGRVEAAQDRLRQARAQTARNLDVAQMAVAILALLSAGVAVVSALFVSRYVTRNLRLIADGMHRLAQGDHAATLPDPGGPRDEIGRLFQAFGVFRANARNLERRTAQITRQNTLFASVFRNIQDGVAIVAPDGVIEAENDQVCALLHLPDDVRKAARTMPDRLAASAFAQACGGNDRGGFEEYTNPAGDVLEVRKSQLPDGRAVWLLSETTERKRIDERLAEIRRVETLGKVTGEVAHDFGNILSTISGNLHLLETTTPAKAPAHLGRIRTAVDLGVSLTERLVAFARKQHLAPEVVEIGSLIEGMVDLLDIALPDSVDLHLSLGDDPLHAMLDPGQLESAVLNVCMNAAQAIPGSGHIWITLRAENGHAVLSVRDDGHGMSEDTRRRAVEPFFSARRDGDGTGLGLPMVDGFVSQSGGTLDITSALGEGTEITIRFPLADGMPQLATAVHTGAALVVDDTPETARGLQQVLHGLGFEALMATRFAQAADIIADRPDLVLVVSDLNLDHGQSGLDLIRSVLAAGPGARAVLMSSRLPADPSVPPVDRDRLTLLAKPVTVDALTDAVARLLT